ncbi:MAG: TonB-dependent receptor [Sideroxydans sp.]|nr:TonB-dependent receptor [Sideroxydans sp.]
MRQFTARLTMAALAAIWAVSVYAQGSEEDELALVYGDKATVSIATGSQQTLRRAPSVASVITAEDIAAMGATDLDEVLETVPGLHVNRSANNYSPLYVIRGVVSQFTPQVLVLQNGAPVTTLFHGNKGNLWGGYPVEHIARIEVIRGPGSALYGSDAYSGVINIITKTAADMRGAEVGVRTGSFNTRDTWVQHGGKAGEIDVATYLRVGDTNGFKSTIKQGAAGTSGPVNVGHQSIDGNLDFSREKWRLRFGYKLRDHLETGAGIASALDPVGSQKSERITGDLSWTDTQFARNLETGFTGSYLQYTQLIPSIFQLFPPGSNIGGGVSSNGFFGGPETWERQVRLSGFVIYSGFAGHSLRFGLGHDDLNLYKTHETRNFTYAANGALIPNPGGVVVDYSSTDPFLRPQHRKIDYLYVQDEWNIARDWALTAGLRHDNYSDFGSTTNPRVALVWDASLDLTAKLLYGSAFRAPAFIEAYGIGNPVAHGNPNLRPETNNTFEAAFSWQARQDTQVNLNLFHYHMRDVIRAVANATPNTGSTYANIGNQYGSGMELESVWDASRTLQISGNYAYQKSIDDATGRDAGYAPHHHIYARADKRFGNYWLFSTQLNRVADRKRAVGDTRSSQIANYTTLDLTVRTTGNRSRWDLAVSLRNLFNADVREPSLAPGTAIPGDLPMAPRSLWLQAVYKL